ncbi:MAG: DciA family protein [Cyanobacteria bacterium J06554_3]
MALEGLDGLIKGLENQDSWQAQRQFRLVVQHWPKSVGFAVARQTRPVSIQRSTLYVATATAAWAQTLAYERLNILRKLNRHQRHPIKNIRFSTAQWAQTQRGPQSPSSLSQRDSQHPSYVGRYTGPMIKAEVPVAPPNDPIEAFARWAQAVQRMQRSQVLCPRCQCRCPKGELDRWAVCSLCAAKQWK